MVINYVSNEQMLILMRKYIDALKENRETQIPDSIVLVFYKIATRYATKGKFSGYSYKEDFIQDSVIWCIKYARNFDPDKYSNVMAYFTQLIHNCFIQRIKSEKDQMKIIIQAEQNMIESDDNVYVRIKDGQHKYVLLDEKSSETIEEIAPEKKISYFLTWEEKFLIFVL